MSYTWREALDWAMKGQADPGPVVAATVDLDTDYDPFARFYAWV